MTFRIGNAVVIAVQEKEKCDLCGLIAECRPYGPNGENICHPCGQKNPEVTERQIRRVLFGEPLQ